MAEKAQEVREIWPLRLLPATALVSHEAAWPLYDSVTPGFMRLGNLLTFRRHSQCHFVRMLSEFEYARQEFKMKMDFGIKTSGIII